jgi:hypothetical protein
MLKQLLSLRGRGAKKWETFVQALGRTRKIEGYETQRCELMRWQLQFRAKLTIKNPLIEELMLWSHRRCDVVGMEMLCSHYPGAEN